MLEEGLPEKVNESFVLIALLLLVGAEIFYVIFVHHWYWYEGAMLDKNYGCGYVDDQMIVWKCWWQQDVISTFFVGTLYLKVFVPAWNSFISNEWRRVPLAALVSLIYTASLG
jgi:hypothetical protein